MRLLPLLCLLPSLAFSQAFSFRDTPFLIKTFTPVASGGCSGTTGGVFANLTHYWNLNQTSGNARTDSVGAISLTESGGTVASAAGICDNAASISSSHFLDSVSVVFPGVGSASSLMFWFKAPALAAVDVFNGTSGGGDGSPICTLSANQLVPGNSGDGGGAVDYNYTADTWHLFVFVSDAAGVQSGSFDGAALQLSDTLESFSGLCQLGTQWSAGTTLIDEVGIFSVALSSADCATLWGGGTNPVFYRP